MAKIVIVPFPKTKLKIQLSPKLTKNLIGYIIQLSFLFLKSLSPKLTKNLIDWNIHEEPHSSEYTNCWVFGYCFGGCGGFE